MKLYVENWNTNQILPNPVRFSGMARCYRSAVDTNWKKTFLPVTSLEIFTVTIFIETDGYRVITIQSYM